jgi:hypothetical protein
MTREIGWTAALILAVAYAVTLSLLSPLTLQDYPAHLENAVTLTDLIFHGGAHFGAMFHYRFLFVPYFLGDLGFTMLVDALGPRVGGALWLTVIVLSLPCALLFFMRVTGVAAERRALVFILGLYLATDWFFLMGFLSFRLGLAVTIVNLALAIRLRQRWSPRAFVIYSVLVVAGYLTHLTTIVFLGTAVGVSGLLRLWRRTSDMRTEALILAPIAAMCVWHFGMAVGYTLPGDPAENPYTWGTWYDKFAGLDYEFIRFHMPSDLLMLKGLAVCVLVSAGRVRLRDLRAPAFVEMLVLAVVFVAMYIALPMGYSEAWYVDVRALALVSVCVILACANLPTRRSWLGVPGPALAILLAIPLAASNLVYLQRHMTRDEAWLRQYRAIVAVVPPGARVLPVATHGSEGHINPYLHANSYIAIDREGLMPYAFTADTANPEKYLRYVHKPYRPDETWYLSRRPPGSVDWRSVVSDYDFVLATKPFDPRRMPLRTTTIAENGSAELLAINK